MAWLRKYWLKSALLTFSSLLAAAVFIASVIAGDDHFKDRNTVLWAGAVMAVLVVLVTAIETTLNEREKTKAREEASQVAAQLKVWHSHVLTDLCKPLGKLTQEYSTAYKASGAASPVSLSTVQSSEYPTIRRAVLVGAATLTAHLDSSQLPTARSAFYRLSNPPQHEFTLEDWAGARSSPRPKMEGAEGSHFRHDILETGNPYHAGAATGYVSKVDQRGEYRSVIAVAVTAGTEQFGVLAVDAPGEADLTAHHVRIVQGLADILGAALALT
ncbi:GAF domain-containing protein [Streptomyces sp. NPDC001165]|uniref:GAF domain-containing protein n=1 Tax=Streptomyces sp. NPDC001165 TaxID=3364546 RepID=UPI00367CFD4E